MSNEQRLWRWHCYLLRQNKRRVGSAIKYAVNLNMSRPEACKKIALVRCLEISSREKDCNTEQVASSVIVWERGIITDCEIKMFVGGDSWHN
jgi:hypothetical protein